MSAQIQSKLPAFIFHGDMPSWMPPQEDFSLKKLIERCECNIRMELQKVKEDWVYSWILVLQEWELVNHFKYGLDNVSRKSNDDYVLKVRDRLAQLQQELVSDYSLTVVV